MPRLCVPPTYQRHRPEDTVLYRTLDRYLEAFLARASDQGGGDGLPAFVTRELRAYLRCGRPEHGCVHVKCEQCGDEMVVAFSCKARGYAEWWDMRSAELRIGGASVPRAGAAA